MPRQAVAGGGPVLKPVRTRRLRTGSWVVVAEGSEPLVVDEATARALESSSSSAAARLLGAEETLAAAGFTTNAPGGSPVPEAPRSAGWRIARAMVWAVGGTLLPAAGVLLVTGGVPLGHQVVPDGAPPLAAVGLAAAVALTTAVPHELGHLAFGRRGIDALRVRARGASATTNLTHIWAWSDSPRLTAVLVGPVIDLALLTGVLLARHLGAGWPAEVAASVLLARLVWQFRFHRTCDGRHLAKLWLDDPLVGSGTAGTSGDRIWRVLLGAGALAEVGLVALWLFPALARLLGLL